MTRSSIAEYIKAQRDHYRASPRWAKRALLDEMERLTGFNRKSLVRALNRGEARSRPEARGRPLVYGSEVAGAAEIAWQASGQISSRRLRPFIASFLASLIAHGELRVGARTEMLLRQASATTLDRLLRPARRQRPRWQRLRPQPAASLRREVPVRSFAEWKGVLPGELQVDLVSHGAYQTSGHYLWTLTAVDVASGWLELAPLWGRNQQVVLAAVNEIGRRLPMSLRSLDSDNGSEFINHRLVDYCRAKGIELTRGRPGKKNDGAYVEQKNGAIVRQLVGYSRFSSVRAYEQLQALYALVRLQVNFFQPVRKLLESHWSAGGKQRRIYDQGSTPFERLCQAGVIDDERRAEMNQLIKEVNPLNLSRQINTEVERLKTLRDRLATKPSVTLLMGQGQANG